MRPYARTVKPVTLQMHKIRNLLLLRPGQCSSVGKIKGRVIHMERKIEVEVKVWIKE